MKQSTKIEGMITDLNLMDWDDDAHDVFSNATEALEDLLIRLQNLEETGDGGRDKKQEMADYKESQR